MSSLFKLNQLSTQQEVSPVFEEPKSVLESQDKEIYALRQQLQTLKALYKHAKAEPSKKNPVDSSTDYEYSKRRIEKLMAVLADREKQMRVLQVEAKQQYFHAIEECQKEKQAKLAALEEISALHGQLDFLKNQVISSQNLLKSQQEQIKALLEDPFFQEKRRQEHLQNSLKDTESLK